MKASLLLAVLLSVSGAQAGQSVSTPLFTKIEFFGLNCTVCEDGLKEKFELLPAVSKVEVDMSAFTVCLRNKPGLTVSGDVIKDTLASVGFNTVKIEPAAKC
jgi:hypothetical protein